MTYPNPGPYGPSQYGPGTHGVYPPVHTQVAVQLYRSSTAHLVVAWIITVLTVGYTLPWAIAATRNKTNTGSIALINILLGWSLVGWVVALVMSLTSEPQPAFSVNTAVFPGQHQSLYGPPAVQAPALPPPGYGYQQPTWPVGQQRPNEPTAILPPYQTDPWLRPDQGQEPPTYR